MPARGTRSPVASVARAIRVQRSITIHRPAEELYRFWRSFERLPQFMEHLQSVTPLGDGRTRWVAKGPAGTSVAWDAVVHNDIPHELIAWRSVGDAVVPNAGSVHFKPAPGGRGTQVRVVLMYDPPLGKAGALVARLFGKEPSQQVRDDLRRFKRLMETGETPRPRRSHETRA